MDGMLEEDDTLAARIVRDNFGTAGAPRRYKAILRQIAASLPSLPASEHVQLALTEYILEGNGIPVPTAAPDRKRPRRPPIVVEPDGDRENRFGPWTIRLTAAGHKYTVSYTDPPVEIVRPDRVGVTTLVAQLFPEFDSAGGIAAMNPDKRDVVYGKMTDAEIVQFWKANGEHKAALGTLMHATVEACIRWTMDTGEYCADVAIPTAPEPPAASRDAYDRVVARPEHIAEVVEVLRGLGLVPVSTEMCMYDDRMHMCGTFDALFRVDGTTDHVLVDWKRWKEFRTRSQWGERGIRGTPTAAMHKCEYSKALVQLNLYCYMIERWMGVKIVRMFIIPVHPDLPTIVKQEIPVDRALQQELVAWRERQLEPTRKI
ncbi:MAG: hypothetical protein WC732_09780 [Candidatus Omnitrophota bacterium]